MALENLQKKYLPRNNDFYRLHYHQFFYLSMILIFLIIVVSSITYYQVRNRPLPVFNAVTPKGDRMLLEAFNTPNLLPDTIIRWSRKAATLAYTFNYVNYKEQLAAVKPYFTANGWTVYQSSVNDLINRIVANQLFVNSVVAGTPVISNQGSISGHDMVWRVQIPFLVTYQSANTLSQSNFIVVLTIVPVPTNINPQGIGIDQFVMV